MSKQYIITVVLLVTLANLASPNDVHHTKSKNRKKFEKKVVIHCEDNSQLQSNGTDCLTCDNYKTTNCTTEISTKCYCKTGYIRGPYNKCILPTQCTKTCKANEVYVTKTPCEFICGGSSYLRQQCNCLLSSGCVCKEGYVRCFSSDNCIPKAECYPDCKANESPYGKSCLPVCENNQTKGGPCPVGVNLECKRICNCMEGYIKDTKNGQCIPSYQCQ